jgi:hypothetical protein
MKLAILCRRIENNDESYKTASSMSIPLRDVGCNVPADEQFLMLYVDGLSERSTRLSGVPYASQQLRFAFLISPMGFCENLPRFDEYNVVSTKLFFAQLGKKQDRKCRCLLFFQC